MLLWCLKASKYFFPIAPPISFQAPEDCLEEPSGPECCLSLPAICTAAEHKLQLHVSLALESTVHQMSESQFKAVIVCYPFLYLMHSRLTQERPSLARFNGKIMFSHTKVPLHASL